MADTPSPKKYDIPVKELVAIFIIWAVVFGFLKALQENL